MATRVFRIDLSEGEGDYTATATEPGLAMLDKQGANYALMQRWFGTLVAEPAWQGTSVNFYVQAEGGGRLEGIECHPVSKEDLEGPLKEQLMQIQARIKRAKPEEAAEVSLHRVVRSTFNNLTKDLEQSDYDSYFFKYRVGRDPWKLLWGWGYQRADHEPAPAIVCTNDDCNQLFVRRPNQRPRCPGCEATVVPRRKGIGAIVSPRNVSIVSVLLLLLLGLMVYLLGQPKLVVEPGDWSGPLGSRVAYKVYDKSWFIFNTDVTNKIVPVSGDTRVLEFDRTGVTARARGQGRASVTFQYQDRSVNATAVVGPPKKPDFLEIELEGDKLELAVGATKQLRVWGKYKPAGGKAIDAVDFTDLITRWGVDDAEIAQHLGSGRFEGAAEGASVLRAAYRHAGEEDYVNGKADLVVVRGEYKQLKLKLDPQLVRRGESARVELVGVDAKGNEHSLTGSSQVALSVEPEAAARLDGSYVVGKAAGKAELKARLGDLTANLPFEVSSESIVAAGTFVVRPAELAMAVNEYFPLEVVTPEDAPITLTSSDEKIVKVLGERGLVALAMGDAKITVKQGDKSQTVTVKVNSSITELRIEPPLIALRVGQTMQARVLGTVTVDGVRREVEVAPEALYWDRLPLFQNAYLDKQTLVFRGLQRTVEPQAVRAMLGDSLAAAASLTVSGDTMVVTTIDALGGDEWSAYGPVALNRRLAWGGLNYDAARGGLLLNDLAADSALYRYRTMLPKGAVITGLGDVDFAGMTPAQIEAYFKAHPQLLDGDAIRYRLAGSNDVLSFRYSLGGTVQAVGYVAAKVAEQTADSIQFSMEVYFDKLAEYRFTDRDGSPLPEPFGGWQTYGPAVNQLLLTPRVPIETGGTYFFHIERKLGDGTSQIFSINVSPK